MQFKVGLKGKIYEIVVENKEVSIVSAVASAVDEPIAVLESTPVVDLSSGEGIPLVAPMPGTILDIKVKVGDKVENSQLLLILEAMKMENEILSDLGGTVTSIVTPAGSSVSAGDILLYIK